MFRFMLKIVGAFTLVMSFFIVVAFALIGMRHFFDQRDAVITTQDVTGFATPLEANPQVANPIGYGGFVTNTVQADVATNPQINPTSQPANEAPSVDMPVQPDAVYPPAFSRDGVIVGGGTGEGYEADLELATMQNVRVVEVTPPAESGYYTVTDANGNVNYYPNSSDQVGGGSPNEGGGTP